MNSYLLVRFECKKANTGTIPDIMLVTLDSISRNNETKTKVKKQENWEGYYHTVKISVRGSEETCVCPVVLQSTLQKWMSKN